MKTSQVLWMVPKCQKARHFHDFEYHSPAGELEMRKNLSKDFKGATRMALMRALK